MHVSNKIMHVYATPLFRSNNTSILSPISLIAFQTPPQLCTNIYCIPLTFLENVCMNALKCNKAYRELDRYKKMFVPAFECNTSIHMVAQLHIFLFLSSSFSYHATRHCAKLYVHVWKKFEVTQEEWWDEAYIWGIFAIHACCCKKYPIVAQISALSYLWRTHLRA